MRKERTDNKFRKLHDVLLTEQGDFDAYDYGYAWSFTHFLMTSPKYGSAYRGFFANLVENKDLEIKLQNIYGYDRAAIGQVTLEDVLDALERRLGKPIDELEKEWLVYFDEAYGEMGPEAYYLAALLALRSENDSEPDVKSAVGFYQKAVDLGSTNAKLYRDYAEMLRKGGMREGDDVTTPLKPDPARAWEMIQKAIELDPIGANNYCEAAGILIMDGPKQDLDKAADLAATALALAGSRDWSTKALYDELMSLIEPARAKREARAEADAEAAKNDNRKWHVAFYFIEGQEQPPNLADISTDDLRELIRSGKVTGRDHLFQSWQAPDPETGKPVAGENPWDQGWVKVRDVPIFAEDLAAASAPAPAAGGESGGDPTAKPDEAPDDPPANPPPPSDGEG
jgi:TPR repeat protein